MPASPPATLQALTAADVMHAPIAAVDPSTPIADVALLMSRLRIHCVIVDGVTRDGAGEHLVWGVVSDLDLVRGALVPDDELTAGRLAGTHALCVDATDDLESVAALLVDHEASHAVVVQDERPVGVLSTLDVAGVLGR